MARSSPTSVRGLWPVHLVLNFFEERRERVPN
jgi:hypothetical protein